MCIEGNLLAWHVEDLRVEVERFGPVEEKREKLCDQETTYSVVIPVGMEIHEAMDLCRKKLNNIIIPIQENLPHLQSFVAWYANTTGNICHGVWTPFSDEDSEGKLINRHE